MKVTGIPWQENEKKVLTSILGGNPPDVVTQVTPVVKWASRNALVSLDKYIYRDNFDSTVFFPALWREMSYNNEIYAIPFNTASYALFYNKRLFREAGLDPNKPPRTWNQVKKYSKKLLRKNEKGNIIQIGYLPDYYKLQTVTIMAWELEAPFYNDDKTRINLTDPKMVKVFQWLSDFYKDYSLNKILAFEAGFGNANQHGFISEKVAMVVLSSSFPDQIEKYKSDLDYGVAKIPTFPGFKTASSAGIWWLAIPRGAKHPDEGWEFIKFSTSKKIALESIKKMESNLFPANKLAATDSSFLKNKRDKIFIENMKYAHSPAIIPLVHDAFWREFIGVQENVKYGANPLEELKNAEKTIQREYKTALSYDKFVQQEMKIDK